MADNRILLVCYDFPPNSGIGGRRWAKFAKGLIQLGYRIHVIRAEQVSQDDHSGWIDDTVSNLITIHSLKRNYPVIVSHGPKGPLGKLCYHFHINRLKNKETGTIYDKAIGWKKTFVPFAKNLIEKEAITDIIVTGAPFNLFYYCAQLKDFFPYINLIADYRDPWLTAENYGMKNLSAGRMEVEINKQQLLFEKANWITCPNEYLLNQIISSARTKPKAEFTSLRHFYDKDDLNKYQVVSQRTDRKIKIVYGGAIYIGMEPHFERLAQGLLGVIKDNPSITDKMRIELYTHDRQFAKYFHGLEEIIQFKEPIGKEFFSELNSADAAFVFLAEHNRDFMTTKFFEYLPFRKPILFLGAEGRVSRFIESNNLGVCLQSDTHIFDVIDKLMNENLKSNPHFDFEGFSLTVRTQELVALLS